MNGAYRPQMSIDPRIVSEWLRLQFVSATDITSSSLGSSSAQGNPAISSDFAALLQLLTAETGNGSLVLEETGQPSPETKRYSLGALDGRVPFSISNASALERPQSPAGFDSMIREASAKYGVDESLVRAVIQVESGYDPNAVSHAGAKGLMQLMDATARSLGITDSLDPLQNVNGGARYLSFLLTKYNGNENVALAAYNAGPGRVDRLGIRTDADLAAKLDRLPKETQSYIRKVVDAK